MFASTKEEKLFDILYHLEAARMLAQQVDHDAKGDWDWFHDPHKLYSKALKKERVRMKEQRVRWGYGI